MKKPLYLHLLLVFCSGIMALPAIAGPKEEAALQNKIEVLELVTAAQKKQIAELRKERDALEAKIAAHEAAIINPKKETEQWLQELAKKTAQEEKARKDEEEYEKNGLVLMRKTLAAKTNKFGGEVTGTIVNRSGRKLKYASVTIGLYDESGARIGTALANVCDLETGGTWKFKAVFLEKDKWSYRVDDMESL